jgi:lambda family phage portal protein
MKRPQLRMNFIDKAIAPFSPGTALRRAKERTALQFMAGSVSRTASGNKGTLGNWFVRRLTRFTEGYERLRTNDRAEDLIANNSHATSIVDSSTLNIVGGAGLIPQSRPNYKALGITEEQAQEIADQAEYWFGVWSKQADAEGSDHFSDLQWVSARSMIGKGEYLNLPVMLETGVNRDFNLAIQVLDSRRLRTPYNLTGNRDIRDGIRLGDHCEKLSYFVAEPDDGKLTTFLTSQNFQEIPAWRGHRPGIFHGFIRKDAEQVRGISVLAPCMKLFRDYDDYMDFEVVGNILAASFPVFITTPEGDDPDDHVGESLTEGSLQKPERYKEYSPGQVMYGAPGQEPKILHGERPGNSFQVFVETLLRAVGAAAGLPYEIVAKDFSKTNYSSARAALLEAYRVFSMYQFWLQNHFCQPIWGMVFEEAWLRGRIKLPKNAPDFYQARAAYCNAKWIPPKRGAIDPVKEVAAGKEEIISNMGTLSDWYAEQGEDWQEQLRQIARERDMMKTLGLTMSDLPGFDLKNLATQPEK